MTPFYRIDFAVDDGDELQRTLNRLYDYEHDVTTKVLHRARLNVFVVLARGLLRRGVVSRMEAALDVGCSVGVYARILADLGFRRVVGIDVVPDAIAVARQTFGGDGLEFRVQRAEDLDESEQFDFVLCTEVIEHTADPERVVANLQRVVAPGGVVVISLPNSFSVPYAAMRAANRLRDREPDADLRAHLRYPFYRSLKLLEGLDRVATTGANFALDPKLLGLLYGRSGFALVNRLNFALSRRWPLKFVSQFFFVVFKRDE